MMENAGGEINLIMVLLIVLGAVNWMLKPAREGKKAGLKEECKSSKKLLIAKNLSNIVIRILLMIYGFLGFDYLLIVLIGLGKYSKDPEQFKPLKIGSVGLSNVIFSLLVYMLSRIQGASRREKLEPALRNCKKRTIKSISDSFFYELKYDGIRNDLDLLAKSHFIRNYNVYFYVLINMSVVVMITFTNSGLLAVALMIAMHFTFNVTFTYY
jgi:hypothetical protein